MQFNYCFFFFKWFSLKDDTHLLIKADSEMKLRKEIEILYNRNVYERINM